MPETETAVAMAERHVRMGEARIVRQTEVLARAVECGDANLERLARALLEQFHLVLAQSRAHLERERREAE